MEDFGSPALRRLGNVVRLADSPAAFLQHIDDALAEGRVQRAAERRAEAARHSWSSRFDDFERLVLERLPA